MKSSSKRAFIALNRSVFILLISLLWCRSGVAVGAEGSRSEKAGRPANAARAPVSKKSSGSASHRATSTGIRKPVAAQGGGTSKPRAMVIDRCEGRIAVLVPADPAQSLRWKIPMNKKDFRCQEGNRVELDVARGWKGGKAPRGITRIRCTVGEQASTGVEVRLVGTQVHIASANLPYGKSPGTRFTLMLRNSRPVVSSELIYGRHPLLSVGGIPRMERFIDLTQMDAPERS